MGWLPEEVERLLGVALVGELTVIGRDGRPDLAPAHPALRRRAHLSPFVDPVLQEARAHQAQPQVALALTDPIAMKGTAGRATIQGTARVIEEDPHRDWERLILGLWRQKEPAIDAFLKARVALPLFFERSVIEIPPNAASSGSTATPRAHRG